MLLGDRKTRACATSATSSTTTASSSASPLPPPSHASRVSVESHSRRSSVGLRERACSHHRSPTEKELYSREHAPGHTHSPTCTHPQIDSASCVCVRVQRVCVCNRSPRASLQFHSVPVGVPPPTHNGPIHASTAIHVYTFAFASELLLTVAKCNARSFFSVWRRRVFLCVCVLGTGEQQNGNTLRLRKQ